MTFDTASGGGNLTNFYDLAEDPTRPTTWPASLPTNVYRPLPRGERSAAGRSTSRARTAWAPSWTCWKRRRRACGCARRPSTSRSVGTTVLAGLKGSETTVSTRSRVAVRWNRRTTASVPQTDNALDARVRREAPDPRNSLNSLQPDQQHLPGPGHGRLHPGATRGGGRADRLPRHPVRGLARSGTGGGRHAELDHHLALPRLEGQRGGREPRARGHQRVLEPPHLLQAHELPEQRGPRGHVPQQRLPRAEHPVRGADRRTVAAREREHGRERRLQRGGSGLPADARSGAGSHLPDRRQRRDSSLPAVLQDPPVAFARGTDLGHAPDDAPGGGSQLPGRREAGLARALRRRTCSGTRRSRTRRRSRPRTSAAAAARSGSRSSPGRYGLGLDFSAANSYIQFPTTDFDKAKGAVEFWVQPYYNHNDGVEHNLAGFRAGPNDEWVLRKATDNSLNFIITASGATSQLVVSSANYSWRANDWVHVRMEWDDAAPLATQQRLLLERGRARPHRSRGGLRLRRPLARGHLPGRLLSERGARRRRPLRRGVLLRGFLGHARQPRARGPHHRHERVPRRQRAQLHAELRHRGRHPAGRVPLRRRRLAVPRPERRPRGPGRRLGGPAVAVLERDHLEQPGERLRVHRPDEQSHAQTGRSTGPATPSTGRPTP